MKCPFHVFFGRESNRTVFRSVLLSEDVNRHGEGEDSQVCVCARARARANVYRVKRMIGVRWEMDGWV